MNTLFFGNNASTAVGRLVFFGTFISLFGQLCMSTDRSSAEPMSDAFVYKIQSSGCNSGKWDIITPRHSNQTTCHHGGSQVKVAVVDDGLGYLQYATLDSQPPVLQTSAKKVCVTSMKVYENCDGNGRMVEYTFDTSNPKSSWYFSYSVISTVGGRQFTDHISIIH